MPPIYQVSTYKQDGVGGLRGGYEYSRSANPTRTALEECLAALEGGSRGFAFASGLAAEDTLLRAVTRPGGHAVIPNDAYGGTYRLFAKVAEPVGPEHTRRPTSATSTPSGRPSVRGETSVVWAETPTNPLLSVADIAALAEIAHDAGALLVVDNTFATPYLQSPLALGADVVVHSTTKYCGGHSDVVGRRARDEPHAASRGADLDERIGFHQNAIGGVAGPFDAWLVLRGLKTLAVRMDRHCDNAERIVGLPRRSTRGSRRCSTRAAPSTPVTRSRPGRCAGSAAWSASGSAAAWRRPSASASGPRSSRSASPSAGSSR